MKLLDVRRLEEVSTRCGGIVRDTWGQHAACWAAPVGVFAVGALCAVAAYLAMASSARMESEEQFAYESEQVAAALDRHLGYYAGSLRDAAAFVESSERVSKREWRRYVATAQATDRLPGAFGMALVRRVDRAGLEAFEAEMSRAHGDGFRVRPLPDADLVGAAGPAGDGVKYVIAYHEPAEVNGFAIGFDLASRTSNKRAYERAMRSGRAEVSEPLELVQEPGVPGVVMMHPVYRVGAEEPRPATPEAREAALECWVAAPVSVRAMIAESSLYDPARLSLNVRLGDGPGAPMLYAGRGGASGAEPGGEGETGTVSSSAGEVDAGGLREVYPLAFGGQTFWVSVTPADATRFAPQATAAWGVFGAVLAASAAAAAVLSTLLRDRRRARDEAQRSARENHALRAALEEHTLFSVTDAAGVIVDVNEGFCRISGYERAELIGRTHRVLNSGHHPKSFWIEMWRTIASGRSWRAEVCNRTKDGSLYWVDSKIIPQIGPDGKIERYVSLRFDITDRKRAEEANRELLAAFERSPDPMTICDPLGNTRYANGSAMALDASVGHELCTGLPSLLFVEGLTPRAVRERILDCIRDGERYEGRVPIARASGGGLAVWLDVNASPLFDAAGVVEGMLIIKRDVTAAVEEEEQARLTARFAETRARVAGILGQDGPARVQTRRALETLVDGLKGELLPFGTVAMFEGEELFAVTETGTSAEGRTRRSICQQRFPQSAPGALRALRRSGKIQRVECFEGAGPHRHLLVPLLDHGKAVGLLALEESVPDGRRTVPDEELTELAGYFCDALVRDIQAKALAEAYRSLDEARSRFELAVRGSGNAIFDWDVSTGEVYFAPRWAELLRTPAENLKPSVSTLFGHVASQDVTRVEQELTLFLEGDGAEFESEFRVMAADGETIWVMLRATAVRDATGRAVRVSGSAADITRLKAAEEQLRTLVRHDPLTGLSSRAALMEALEEGVAATEDGAGGRPLAALLFFDFDRFKVVNDSLGHEVGDELLCSIASRLTGNIGPGDIAARFGGDEFVVFLPDLSSVDDARRAADRLLTACAEPHAISGHSIVSTASIGLVTTQSHTGGPAELLRDADAAMYQAKIAGRGRVVEFDEDMHRASLDRLAIEADLRTAADAGQLFLVYQAIVELESGVPIGGEALVRWRHPERGFIPPNVFIPIAEESNQIRGLGRWILREACRQLAAWRGAGAVPEGFRVSVNLSKAELLAPGFADELEREVRSAGLDPQDVKLEVTETTIVDNRADVTETLKALRSLGYAIMMDDFGTGHSSLSGLHSLPIDELKIDQSFIRQADTSTRLAAITTSIISLAEHLDLHTVGEGIETAEHIALLQAMGCTHGQGYFFCKPLQADEFTAWLGEQRRAAA